jgi:hypothetical protein
MRHEREHPQCLSCGLGDPYLKSPGNLVEEASAIPPQLGTEMCRREDYAGDTIGVVQNPVFQREIQVGPHGTKQLTAVSLGQPLKRGRTNAGI